MFISECNEPPLPDHAINTTNGPYYAFDNITYECAPMFMHNGGDLTRMCDGQAGPDFFGDAPVCDGLFLTYCTCYS